MSTRPDGVVARAGGDARSRVLESPSDPHTIFQETP